MAQECHPSDQELLLFIDGELSARDAGRVDLHLSACWACRLRKQEMDAAIHEFIRFHRQNLDPQIPSAEGPRALLKAHLAQSAGSRLGYPLEWLRSTIEQLGWRVAAVVFLAAALAFVSLRDFSARRRPTFTSLTVPNPSLTPGATVLLSKREVCRESVTKNKAVAISLRRRVFDEYGIRAAAPDAFEIDYLITPALGGADDIRNLWPQPDTDVLWTAQVKDQLEDRLRDLVCDGQLELATAQQEIAGNWIEAYKKYFHTDRPLLSSAR